MHIIINTHFTDRFQIDKLYANRVAQQPGYHSAILLYLLLPYCACIMYDTTPVVIMYMHIQMMKLGVKSVNNSTFVFIQLLERA